jgi:type I restriction enzyme R subunit
MWLIASGSWQRLASFSRRTRITGIGTPDDITRAKEQSSGLGVFIRSLVGLDREVANYLTENGVMDPRLLYESRFTDVSPRAAEGVFS